MFKVGDIIVHKKNLKKQGQYRILEFRDTIMIVETVTDKPEELSRHMITLGDELYDVWELDKNYYRKKKLEKICSNLVK